MDTELITHIRKKIDNKTKPLGALGQLEQLAEQIAYWQQTLSPSLSNPAILVFAGDHGVAAQGVSAYPSEVTFQMVLNFIHGGAAINVLTRQHAIALQIIDTGVIGNFKDDTPVVNYKVAPGTADFALGRAMNDAQYAQCFHQAELLVEAQAQKGCNVVGFGEMGIGNTASASMIMHYLSNYDLDQCVGRGTGLDDSQYAHKLNVLQKAVMLHGALSDAHEVLKAVGGFEIVHICAAMLKAYEKGMLILVDGFIASCAYLAAFKINPQIAKGAIFCHQSHEQGHQHLLSYLDAQPILQMQLRLGEGTGCALAYPIVESAVRFFNEMASFESAGVSQKNE